MGQQKIGKTLVLKIMKDCLLMLSFCLISFSLNAQNGSSTSLVDALKILEKWHYNDPIDIDSLAKEVGHSLVQKLEKGPMANLDSISNLSVVASLDSQVFIYTFAYESWGTRGTIHLPIVQWVKPDGSYGAYELFPQAKKRGFTGIETHFQAIHKLPAEDQTLYLLVGKEEVDREYYLGHAMVIQVKGPYLILDYPAFQERDPILAFDDYGFSGDGGSCGIACIEYQEGKSEIFIPGLGTRDVIRTTKGRFHQTKTLDVEGELSLVFNGKRFQRQ